MKKRKRYNSLFEATKWDTYKAWMNPSNDYFCRWKTNNSNNESSDHEDKAKELFNLDISRAFDKGYFRISVNDHGLNIQSKNEPTEKEFKCLQKCLSKYTNLAKIKFTIFEIKDVIGKGNYYTFPKQSFFIADSFEDLKNNNGG